MSRQDTPRRVWVIVTAVLGIAGVALGVGVLGPSVGDNSDASVAQIDTLIAPGGPAFGMWTVIYLGLAGYVILHSLPGRAADARMQSTGWLAGASLLLNALWITVAQLSPNPALGLWGSLVVIVVLAIVCGLIVARLTDQAAQTRVEAVLVDGTFGLYLGWVSVATCANVAATLVGSGVDPAAPWDWIIAIVVLAVVVALAAVLFRRLGARVAVAAALAWGLGWIGVGRLTEPPQSTPVAVASGIAVLAVVGLLLVRSRSTGLRL